MSKTKERTSAAPATPTHVAALDAQFADLLDRLPAIQRASQDAEATADRLRREYETLAYRQHVSQDAIDEGTLAHAFAEYEAARRRQNDADVAASAIVEKLRELESQREEAKRADASAELTATAPAFDARSVKLDRLADEFAAELREWLGDALRQHGLARRTGKSIGMTPQALAGTVVLSRLNFLQDLPRPISSAPELSSFASVGRRFYAARNDEQKKSEDAA